MVDGVDGQTVQAIGKHCVWLTDYITVDKLRRNAACCCMAIVCTHFRQVPPSYPVQVLDPCVCGTIPRHGHTGGCCISHHIYGSVSLLHSHIPGKNHYQFLVIMQAFIVH